MSLKPGDVVQMKSGGPQMTIETVDGDNAVCSWMERSGTQSAPKYAKKKDVFLSITLVTSGPRAIGVSMGHR